MCIIAALSAALMRPVEYVRIMSFQRIGPPKGPEKEEREMRGKEVWTIVLAVVLAVGASSAVAASLQVVPVVVGQTSSEVRAITSDGRYVAGNSGTSGLFWDSVTAPANSIAPISGAAMKQATGIAYRNGTTEVAVHGLLDYASGTNTPVIGITLDGGASWNKSWRDGAVYHDSILGAANTLASGGGDVLWNTFRKNGNYTFSVGKFSGPIAPLTVGMDNKSTSSGSELTVNGVSALGLAAGSRMASGVQRSYYMQGLGGGTSGRVAYVPGLDSSLSNEAFCAAGDDTAGGSGRIFGRTHKAGDARYYPYMYSFATNSISYLPMFGDEDGSTTLATVYGCSEDGRYAVGMLYRGTEKAVLWDTQLNTVTDLTQFAIDYGLNDDFTRLSRAYAVGVNALGQPVVGGTGVHTDGIRGFVLTVPEPATVSLLVLGGLALLRRRMR